jgi:hypothetical protein
MNKSAVSDRLFTRHDHTTWSLAVEGETAVHLTGDHGLGPITRLWHAVVSFPSISGVWVRLIERVSELSVAPCRAAG